MRDHSRKGGAQTRTQWALNKCPFSPFPRPFSAPAPSQSQPQLVPRTRPQLAPALRGPGRRPPVPSIRALSPAALGSRPRPGQKGPLCVLFRARAEPLAWGVKKVAARARSTSPVQFSPTGCRSGTSHRTLTLAGASCALARSQVRTTGSKGAEASGLGEPEAGGVQAPLH